MESGSQLSLASNLEQHWYSGAAAVWENFLQSSSMFETMSLHIPVWDVASASLYPMNCWNCSQFAAWSFIPSKLVVSLMISAHFGRPNRYELFLMHTTSRMSSVVRAQ